ncbi:hypothetical protein FPZ43_11440 [Mucilaginibacter pallidiroseus]|uniref:DNA alkylation repair enzyme n=1 Tax=Mucilaginibacter pallidiroseus TaxID=2599295 RepID=A0A563UBY6_9SPHI|nr:EboA domain-containing protein [Mucilaginibacter pallidiroseus]TWR28877.1 hypothetical protein FPZ43_11440 [Mucilaginibacter pallidiroseus]
MITEFKSDRFIALLSQILKANIPHDAYIWLNNDKNVRADAFDTAFASMPRKTGRRNLTLSADQLNDLRVLRNGLSLNNWTADRLGRVQLLMRFCLANDKDSLKIIESLFATAEMNEQIALYSAIPLLPIPKYWVKRCIEGIRSNLDPVLEAIMYGNPYPAENLDESSWNQMVLKAFFTSKRVDLIYGLKNRANPELVRMLIDYAQERRAAGREIPHGLHELIESFTDPKN